MSRDFTRASGDKIAFGDVSAINFDTSDSFTIYAWFWTDNTADESHIFHYWDGDDDVTPYPFSLRLSGNRGGDPVRLVRYDGTNVPLVEVALPGTIGEWHFVMCGRDDSEANELFMTVEQLSSRSTGLPAFTRANDTTTATTVSTDLVAIGSWPYDGNHFEGKIARIIVCNAAHPIGIGESVFVGKLPPDIVFYSELFGNESPEPDWSSGSASGTVTGATQADHPSLAPPFGWAGSFDLEAVVSLGRAIRTSTIKSRH